jgi:signal transduction histidine kinase
MPKGLWNMKDNVSVTVTSAELSDIARVNKLNEQISKLLVSERKLYDVQKALDVQVERMNSLSKLHLLLSSDKGVADIISVTLQVLAESFVVQYAVSIIYEPKTSTAVAQSRLFRGKPVENIAKILSGGCKASGVDINQNVTIIIIRNQMSPDDARMVDFAKTCLGKAFDGVGKLEFEDDARILLMTKDVDDDGKKIFLLFYCAPPESLGYREKTLQPSDFPFLNLFYEHFVRIVDASVYHRRLHEFANALQLKVNELTQLARELQHATNVKSEFLANMSHELRTPLNSVIGFSEVLNDETFGPINEKQKSYIAYILSSAKHLLDLVNDVLSLSKIEAGKMELVLTLFSLPRAIGDVVVLFKEIARKKGVKISVEVAGDVADIYTDERRFKEVICNLLANAVKFTPAGKEVNVKVWLDGQEKDKQQVVIEIRDSGVGIAAEDIPKLFKVFTQIDSSISRTAEGTGLGLVYSKKLTEMMGGEIDIESPGVDQGTIARVILPLRQLLPAPEEQTPAAPAASAAALTTNANSANGGNGTGNVKT